MPEKEEKRVVFRFGPVENAPIYHVDGAWGGPSPDGTMHAWLYVDVPEFPSHETVSLDAETGNVTGRSATMEQHAGEVVAHRIFQCGLVMSPEKARAIGQWLCNHAEELDTRLKGREPGA